jgi:DNA invertase Pin-like site-specific DNA recombinase
MDDLSKIARRLREQGIALKAAAQPLDSTNVAGNAFVQMLGTFAALKTGLRKEGRMEGIFP